MSIHGDMSEDEFYDEITRDIAETAGVTVEEVEEMTISELEEEMGIEPGEPKVHGSLAHRYPHLASDRYEIVTEEALEERRERVEQALYGENPGYAQRILGAAKAPVSRAREVFSGLF